MNFKLRVLSYHAHMNTPICLYPSGDHKEKNNSLVPECIYGRTFKDLRRNIRDEFKQHGDHRLEMTQLLKQRFSKVEKKITSMMHPGQHIQCVYFHVNRQMPFPMIIVCLGVYQASVSIQNVEQGHVIVSGVDTLIEDGKHKFGNRCDFYEGMWRYHRSGSGKSWIEIDFTRRQDEKPLAVRGVERGVIAQHVRAKPEAIESVQEPVGVPVEPERDPYQPDPAVVAMLAGMKQTNEYRPEDDPDYPEIKRQREEEAKRIYDHYNKPVSKRPTFADTVAW